MHMWSMIGSLQVFRCLLGASCVDAIHPVAGQRNEELEVPLSSLRYDEVQVLEGR